MECFSLGQRRFVFVNLFSDISMKSKELYFQSWRKISLTILLLFRRKAAKVSWNSCAKRYKGLNISLRYFRYWIPKLARSSLPDFRFVCLHSNVRPTREPLS